MVQFSINSTGQRNKSKRVANVVEHGDVDISDLELSIMVEELDEEVSVICDCRSWQS
ncbi:hypothetical protein OROHE_026176 [Orobanche hederae]